MKPLAALLALVLLAGCATLCPQSKLAIPLDLESFSRALDSFQITNRITELQQFISDFPDSSWAPRAETIVLYAQELDQRKQQIAALREKNQQQEAALDQQELDLQSLQQENQQLVQTIEQLKGLLIQLEQHPQ